MTLPARPHIDVSVIVPTYCEAENLGILIPRISKSLRDAALTAEIIVVDDNSPDSTRSVCEELARSYPLVLLVREHERGLSSAVLHGIRHATGDFIQVMDADLSHPPEKIPDLIRALQNNEGDFVIGSRYVDGGTTDADWGAFRWLNSKVATCLAVFLTTARDPMAGFFALRRDAFLAADALDPIGYKIGLELIVKCRSKNVVEVPIHFQDRLHGESKLTLKEQLNYLRHVKRLYEYKLGRLGRPLQFAAVGASGLVVDLLVLYLALFVLAFPIARIVGVAAAMTWNYAFNRILTFSDGKHRSWWAQYLMFCLSCSFGAVASWAVSVTIWQLMASRGMLHPLLAAAAGTVIGSTFNYIAAATWVFRPNLTAQRVERFDRRMLLLSAAALIVAPAVFVVSLTWVPEIAVAAYDNHSHPLFNRLISGRDVHPPSYYAFSWSVYARYVSYGLVITGVLGVLFSWKTARYLPKSFGGRFSLWLLAGTAIAATAVSCGQVHTNLDPRELPEIPAPTLQMMVWNLLLALGLGLCSTVTLFGRVRQKVFGDFELWTDSQVHRFVSFAVLFSLAAMLLTVLSGVQHDYEAFLVEWDAVREAEVAPWGTHSVNAYGPLFNVFALLTPISPLLPKMIFTWAWIVACHLITAWQVRNRADWSTLQCTLGLLWLNPSFWVDVPVFGLFDMLTAVFAMTAVHLVNRNPAASALAFAASFFLKFYTAPLAVYMVVANARPRLRLALWLFIVIVGGFTAAWMVWGSSVFYPIVWAGKRSATQVSVFRFLQGRFSPLILFSDHPRLEQFGKPLMALSSLAFWIFCVVRRAHLIPACLGGMLIALTWLPVGHTKFASILFLMGLYWMGGPAGLRPPLSLQRALVAYLVWFSVPDAAGFLVSGFYWGPPGYIVLYDVIGLPSFVIACWLMFEIVRCISRDSATAAESSLPALAEASR